MRNLRFQVDDLASISIDDAFCSWPYKNLCHSRDSQFTADQWSSSISLFRLCLLYSLKIAGFGINKLLPADTLSRQEW